MLQETINAGFIRLDDYLIFGNALYRVAVVNHEQPEFTQVTLKADQMQGGPRKVTIIVKLHKDHIVTVMRTK